MTYLAGEVAKKCNITLRTVQFYDVKEIVKPSSLTGGGRRLYTQNDLRQIQAVCFLKKLGLSLNSIKGIIKNKDDQKLILLFLDEQLKKIETSKKEIKNQQKLILSIKKRVLNNETFLDDIVSIESDMEDEDKLKKVYKKMWLIGGLCDVIELVTIIIWVKLGFWLPFLVGMLFIIATCTYLTKLYYKSVSYICPNCHFKFNPNFKTFFLAPHTPKTRRLKCPSCHEKHYCFEVYKKRS